MSSSKIFADTALLPEGWAKDVLLHVENGAISTVQPDTGKAPGDAVCVGIAAPAIANLHSHSFQRAMAGLTEMRGPGGVDSFWTWRKLMYRFLEVLSADDIEAIAAFAFMEMLEAGFASAAEFHYLHHQPGGVRYSDPAEMSARIVVAAKEAGIGLTLLPVLYQYGGCDRRALEGGQLRFGNSGSEYELLYEAASRAIANGDCDARLGVAAHSLRAVPREGIDQLVALAGDGPIHIHIAEQMAEVEEVQAAYGSRPVEWLLDNVDVDPMWCLVHATHMTPDETTRLAKSGAVAGLCPITECNLGDGIFDGTRFLGVGGAFGVGSDSNIRIDLSEELRILEYSQRLAGQARAVLSAPQKSVGRTLFEFAAAGGAQALGRQCGAIAPGKRADILALDAGAIDFAGKAGDQLLDALIFCGGRDLVTDVWSGGRHMVQAGRHIMRDALASRYRATLEPLLARIN